MIETKTIDLTTIDLRMVSANDFVLMQYQTVQSRTELLADVFEACNRYPDQINVSVNEGRISMEIYCEKAKAFDSYIVNIEGNYGHHVSWIKGFLMFKRKMNIE